MPHSGQPTQPSSFTIDRLVVDRGANRVLDGVSLDIGPQARVAVVGPNGVGKSTLLLAIAGLVEASAGAIVRRPPTARVGLLDQMPDRSPTMTGRELAAHRAGIADVASRFAAATQALADDEPGAADRYDRALHQWQSAGGFDFDPRIEAACAELGLDPATLDRPTATLSGGEMTKLGLASMLTSRFDLTLLDEPTNNLDTHGLDLLERWVGSYGGPIVMVSHDRAFLDRTVTAVAAISGEGHGGATGIEVHTGTYSDYERQVGEARRRHQQRYAEYVGERSRLERLAQRKREWADQGTSRVTKRPDNDRNSRMYHLAKAQDQVGAAKAVAKRLERLEAVDAPWRPWELRFTIAEADRGSAQVIVADELIVRRGDFALGPLSLTIGRGERVLIAGPNGSGKTTLLDALTGRLAPSTGTVTMGPSTIVGRVGQMRAELASAEGAPLLSEFVDRSGLLDEQARSLLAKFGVDADSVGRSIAHLSPGQVTRAELALFQARGVNLVVLDEPTNHLDIEAIEQLEHALGNYQGTLLAVTHDRRFRDAIAIDRVIDLAN